MPVVEKPKKKVREQRRSQRAKQEAKNGDITEKTPLRVVGSGQKSTHTGGRTKVSLIHILLLFSEGVLDPGWPSQRRLGLPIERFRRGQG